MFSKEKYFFKKKNCTPWATYSTKRGLYDTPGLERRTCGYLQERVGEKRGTPTRKIYKNKYMDISITYSIKL